MKQIILLFCFFIYESFAAENFTKNNNLCVDKNYLGQLDKKIIKDLKKPTSKVVLKSEKELFVNIFDLGPFRIFGKIHLICVSECNLSIIIKSFGLL